MEIIEARRLATALMQQHGLTGWRLVMDNAKTRAGVCRAGRREIGLSRVLTRLHSDEAVRDTILHEIAHALVGPQHGHGATWKVTARSIGCSATRCVPATEARAESPWTGTCPSGHVLGRHRRPTRLISCGRCRRTFDLRTLLRWTYRGRVVPMHPDYVRQLAALERRISRSDVDASQLALLPPLSAESSRRRTLPVGALVRVAGAGRYAGTLGRIEKVGRTRYRLATRLGAMTAPFELVTPL